MRLPKLPGMPCPTPGCEATFAGHGPILHESEIPGPGGPRAITVCGACGIVIELTDDGMIKVTDRRILTDPAVAKLRAFLTELRRQASRKLN